MSDAREAFADLPHDERLPLSAAIREASDAGEPPAASGGEDAQAFEAIAAQLLQVLAH